MSTPKTVWYIRSESDSRWCAAGTMFWHVPVPQMPRDCREKYEEFRNKNGTPPEDLEWGYEDIHTGQEYEK